MVELDPARYGSPMVVDGELAFPPLGSYAVVHCTGFVPDMISLGTRCWANHALVVTGDRGECVEAEPGGARRGHLSEYVGHRLAYCVEGTPGQRLTVAQTALTMVGLAYEDLDIADLGLRCLGLPWRALNVFVEGHGHGAICSTLVARCGQAAGLDWLCGRPNAAAVTPADLERRPGVVPFTVG